MGSPALMEVPGPFTELRRGEATVWARTEALEWVEEALDQGLTLHEAAGKAVGTGDVLLGGRGPAFRVRSPAGAWVVRHAWRGGAVARLLEDRYLRIGIPRPLREAAVSIEVRRRGIATPRVMAAAVYPAGPFYRGDVVTGFIPEARTLGNLLFGEERSRDEVHRKELLRAAGEVPRRLAEAGVRHRDLNVDNLLIPGGAGEPGPILLDLDRCQLRRRADPLWGRKMAARLARSLRKGEAGRGPALAPGEWDTFRGVSTAR